MVPYTAPPNQIVHDFEESGINTSVPGFYDQDAFKEGEVANPHYLYNYARFVRTREYDQDYLQKAEKIIRVTADILLDELERDGREGACVDLNIAFSRILEREGVWNHFVNGSLVIDGPADRVAGLYSIDFGEQVAGHGWLHAPPFDVIDLTLGQQPYPSSVDRTIIPKTILEKTLTPLSLEASDIFSPAKLEEAARSGVPLSASAFERDPAFAYFVPLFPGNLIKRNGLTFRYNPVAINASSEPLEGIINYPMNGRTAKEIYEQTIQPRLAALQLRDPDRRD